MSADGFTALLRGQAELKALIVGVDGQGGLLQRNEKASADIYFIRNHMVTQKECQTIRNGLSRGTATAWGKRKDVLLGLIALSGWGAVIIHLLTAGSS
jgi:hypothetical protein